MNRKRSGKSNRPKQMTDASGVFRQPRVEFLVDGYNLLHVTRFKPVSNAEGELRRCREGLLQLLSQQVPENIATTIVFDANMAPKHLPDDILWKHIRVRFARHENTADDLIIKLLQQHSSARDLVVVSSDHRVQQMGLRRRANVVDSDVWFDALLDYSRNEDQELPSDQASEKA